MENENTKKISLGLIFFSIELTINTKSIKFDEGFCAIIVRVMISIDEFDCR
jgi:hypothetical protein